MPILDLQVVGLDLLGRVVDAEEVEAFEDVVGIDLGGVLVVAVAVAGEEEQEESFTHGTPQV